MWEQDGEAEVDSLWSALLRPLSRNLSKEFDTVDCVSSLSFFVLSVCLLDFWVVLLCLRSWFLLSLLPPILLGTQSCASSLCQSTVTPNYSVSSTTLNTTCIVMTAKFLCL